MGTHGAISAAQHMFAVRSAIRDHPLKAGMQCHAERLSQYLWFSGRARRLANSLDKAAISLYSRQRHVLQAAVCLNSGLDVLHRTLRSTNMKTFDVRTLVNEALRSLPQPYTEHVIDEVFHAIESNPVWLREYGALCDSLGKTTVNTWGGRWIGLALGKIGEQQVSSQRSSLIGSYSILDTDAKSIARKPKEPEALQMMSDYYRANKDRLPADIRKYREQIIELIMEGVPPSEAFSLPTNDDA